MNLKILYEDNHIIVVVKPVGIPVQEDKTKDIDMLSIIKKYFENLPHELANPLDNKTYISMTNVGTNPTVNGCERTVETNIFGFSGDIYGKNIKTYFFEYLRGEKKFSGIEELSKRLEKDKSITKEYFSSNEFKKWADRY